MLKDKRRLTNLFEIAKDNEVVAHARIVSGLYVKNELVSVGFNSYKTSPFAKYYGKNSKSICLHAETTVIKQALQRFTVEELLDQKTTIYIARAKKIDGKWQWGLAKPCLGCLRAILDYDIKRCVFTTDTGEVGELM